MLGCTLEQAGGCQHSVFEGMLSLYLSLQTGPLLGCALLEDYSRCNCSQGGREANHTK